MRFGYLYTLVLMVLVCAAIGYGLGHVSPETFGATSRRTLASRGAAEPVDRVPHDAPPARPALPAGA
ncbi:MAG: hypothetical protein ACYCX7_09455, partial [Solirubrobacteraceae bacterium]